VRAVDGARAFRRRLLEMGLVPGTPVRIVTVAPLAAHRGPRRPVVDPPR
jgi:Fe2+ transport system protein FeoA